MRPQRSASKRARTRPAVRFKVEKIDPIFYCVNKLRRTRLGDNPYKVVPATSSMELRKLIEMGRLFITTNGTDNEHLPNIIKINPNENAMIFVDDARAMGLRLVTDEHVKQGSIWIGYTDAD